MNFHRLFWILYVAVITPITFVGGFSFGGLWGWHGYFPALPAAGVWVGIMALFVMIARMDASLEYLERSKKAGQLLATRVEGADDQLVIPETTAADELRALRQAEEQWGLGSQLGKLHERLLGETVTRVALVDRWATGGYFNVRAPVVTIVTESGKVVELLPYLPMSTASWIVTPDRTSPVPLARAS